MGARRNPPKKWFPDPVPGDYVAVLSLISSVRDEISQSAVRLVRVLHTVLMPSDRTLFRR